MLLQEGGIIEDTGYYFLKAKVPYKRTTSEFGILSDEKLMNCTSCPSIYLSFHRLYYLITLNNAISSKTLVIL